MRGPRQHPDSAGSAIPVATSGHTVPRPILRRARTAERTGSMAKKKDDEVAESAGAAAGTKMKTKDYEREMRASPRRAGRAAGVGQGHRRQGLHRVRGPGHGRQGRHDQADHRAGQPARVPGRRSVGADRTREVPDVRPALPGAFPGGRRGRDLRPQLVQPGRRRAGHGLLHARGEREVPRAGAGRREGDGRLRDHPDQVLARGQP